MWTLDDRSRRGAQRAVQRLPVADGPVLRRAALRSGSAPGWSQRLWLGLMLRALGVGRCCALLDVLRRQAARDRARGRRGASTLLNPYMVVFTARTSITLLGYAALPWLLLIIYRGVRARPLAGWRGWWWAAAFALVLDLDRRRGQRGGRRLDAASARCVLGLYEPAMGAVRWRDAGRFLVLAGRPRACWRRCGGSCRCSCTSRYGIDFLQFTEQPGTIWGTNSVTETLRLMGYWTSYIGVGFGVTRPVLLRRPDDDVQPVRRRRLAAAARVRDRRLRLRAAAGATGRSCCC